MDDNYNLEEVLMTYHAYSTYLEDECQTYNQANWANWCTISSQVLQFFAGLCQSDMNDTGGPFRQLLQVADITSDEQVKLLFFQLQHPNHDE